MSKRNRRRNRRPCPLLPSSSTCAAIKSTGGSISHADYEVAKGESTRVVDDTTTVHSSTTTKPATTNHKKLVLVRSRKMARKITTLFHKYTHQKEELLLSLSKQRKENEETNSKEHQDDYAHNGDMERTSRNTNDPRTTCSNICEQIRELDEKIEQIGGRTEYQRASQISTSYHSTSKWILGYLSQNGLLYGTSICLDENEDLDNKKNNVQSYNVDAENGNNIEADKSIESDTVVSKTKKRKRCDIIQRRTTRILEIGAINTELLDAADAVIKVPVQFSFNCLSSQSLNKNDIGSSINNHLDTNNSTSDSTANKNNENVPHSEQSPISITSSPYLEETNSRTEHRMKQRKKYNIHVRAIDLHSMFPNRIEELDFMKLEPPSPISVSSSFHEQKQQVHNNNNYYDVIVCSMVLNCVPTADERGRMLQKIYQHLNPYTNGGGLCFLIIPKTCITLSKYIRNEDQFKQILTDGIGFELIQHKKTSPKLLYYILRKSNVNNCNNIRNNLPTPTISTNNNDNQTYRNDCEKINDSQDCCNKQHLNRTAVKVIDNNDDDDDDCNNHSKKYPTTKQQRQQKQKQLPFYYYNPPKIMRPGTKYRNTFSIVLPQHHENDS